MKYIGVVVLLFSFMSCVDAKDYRTICSHIMGDSAYAAMVADMSDGGSPSSYHNSNIEKYYYNACIYANQIDLSCKKVLIKRFAFDEDGLHEWYIRENFMKDMDLPYLLQVTMKGDLRFSGFADKKVNALLYDVNNDIFIREDGSSGKYEHRRWVEYPAEKVACMGAYFKIDAGHFFGLYAGRYKNGSLLSDMAILHEKRLKVMPISGYYEAFPFGATDNNKRVYLMLQSYEVYPDYRLKTNRAEVYVLTSDQKDLYSIRFTIDDQLWVGETPRNGIYVLGEDQNIYYQTVTDKAYYVFRIDVDWDHPSEEKPYDPVFFEFEPELKKIWEESKQVQGEQGE